MIKKVYLEYFEHADEGVVTIVHFDNLVQVFNEGISLKGGLFLSINPTERKVLLKAWRWYYQWKYKYTI